MPTASSKRLLNGALPGNSGTFSTFTPQSGVWRQLLFPVNDNYFSRRRQLQTC
jgi:hypothetical protein